MRHGSILRRDRRRLGPGVVGIVSAVAVVWGGLSLVGADGGTGVDVSVEEARLEGPLERRESGETSGRIIPAEPPFVADGFVLEYRIEANAPQAAAYGVPAERARSWGFVRVGDGETSNESATTVLMEAARRAGAEIAKRPGGTGGEFVNLAGTWNGLVLLVSVHSGTVVTVSLIDAR